MEKIDFVFIIEHPKRELLFVKEVAKRLKAKGHVVRIYSLHYHLHKLLTLKDSVVLMPYCLSPQNFPFSLLPKGRGLKFINMNWEQMLSPISKSSKHIKGRAKKVFQLCWHEGFRSFLKDDNQVTDDAIISSVNPTAFIISKTGSEAVQPFLDRHKIGDFIFMPLNYNWAMMNEWRIEKRLKLGYSREDADLYVNYSKKHQQKMFAFMAQLIADGHTLVVRPHPSITVESYIDRINELGLQDKLLSSGRLHITDDYSAADWVNAASITISNWSSLVNDAYLAGKTAAYFWPEQIPTLIDGDYTKKPSKIVSPEELDQIETRDPEKLTSEFNNLLEGLETIHGINEPVQFKKYIIIKDYIKVVRSVVYLLLLRIGLKILIRKRILVDYFESDS